VWTPAASSPHCQPRLTAKDRDPDSETEIGVVEEQSVEAVRRQVRGVLLEGVAITRHAPVQRGIGQLDLPKAKRSGECGSPSTSVKAWWRRCTAAHSRGLIPVVIQMRNRKVNDNTASSGYRGARPCDGDTRSWKPVDLTDGKADENARKTLGHAAVSRDYLHTEVNGSCRRINNDPSG